jgi:nicotinamidase-related amidase
MREGYEVYPVVDALGGTTPEAHEAAMERLVQAGARPVTWVQLICELQRDWARTETVPPFREILFDASSPVRVNESSWPEYVAQHRQLERAVPR